MKVITDYAQAVSALRRSLPYGYGGKIEAAVNEIIEGVRQRGDKALFEYTRRFDGAELKSLEVSRGEISAALKSCDSHLIRALRFAARRVEKFHKICLKKCSRSFLTNGLGQQVLPLQQAGIYVPGGTAAYPSTVLMTAIPARVAGVGEIIMATPCGPDGRIPANTLAAASIAGVDRIFKLGGAQAVAALAFGTKSVPRVDKICGPGNIYVMTAKKMVFGVVGIDALQGPSEIAVIADSTADPAFCAADLIAQSEHDSLASSVFITTSKELAARVQSEINKQLSSLKRGDFAGGALKANGIIVIVSTMEQAVELVNLYAPEHLSIMAADAARYIGSIRNAGCICAGQYSPVVLGDYVAGPSHALPTGGSARFSSPLSVQDFLKISSVIALDNEQIEKLGPPAMAIAEQEGLTGHAKAVDIRLQKRKNRG
jgi:histidinol dehydrogenase